VEGLERPDLEEVEAISHRITSERRAPVPPLLDIRADQVWEILAVWVSEAGNQSTEAVFPYLLLLLFSLMVQKSKWRKCQEEETLIVCYSNSVLFFDIP
jgi:hypothetical protein